ncbi:MAG: glycosyltransferase, partial [Armatimonadota bacterium]
MADIPSEHEIDVTISIVNWNTREDLLACLRSFIPETERQKQLGASFLIDGFSCEVIVVDNFSEDHSAEAVAESFPIVRLLPQDTNLGFGAGHNKAFVLSRGRYVLALNP